MTTVFIPKETAPGEARVAATPETVARFVKAGLRVVVASGAGAAACFLDPGYRDAGAESTEDAAQGFAGADLILKVAPPSLEEARRLRRGALLISFLYPSEHPALVQALSEQGVTAFAMDLIPRVSRAQKMDALSSQANVAGYKAVLLAAYHLGKYFPLMMTAAGTVKPAKVVVFGAGVAGLQAIATAKRLGAVVWATDIRPEVKEQVESLGAKYIEVAPGAAAASVYAQEASEEYRRRQAEAVAAHLAAADVVITTAQVPGRRAPLLIPAAMVGTMRPGSVIVDLAAGQGGNCALSQPDRTVVQNGVVILGTTNLAATVPVHASELYARNVQQAVQHLIPAQDNDARAPRLDFADEITAGAVAVHASEIRSRELLSSATA